MSLSTKQSPAIRDYLTCDKCHIKAQFTISGQPKCEFHMLAVKSEAIKRGITIKRIRREKV